jgi:hypothetical protein
MHNMFSNMGELNMSSDLVFGELSRHCIHNCGMAGRSSSIVELRSFSTVGANAVPPLRIDVPPGWVNTVGDASGYARSYGIVLVVRLGRHAYLRFSA